MIKKILAIITAVLICLSVSVCVSAYSDGYVIVEEFDGEFLPDEVYDEFLSDEIYEEFYADDEFEPIEKPSKISVPFIWLPISLAIGLLIGFLIIGGIASKNNSVKMQKNATVYERAGSMTITNSTDRFIHSHIDRRPKPKQPPKK